MSKANKRFQNVLHTTCMIFLLYGNSQSDALPKESNNAALLYYQAFLLQPEPDEATFLLFDKITKGADPNESIKKYLNLPYSRATIKLVHKATQIPLCDWGPLYPGGYGHNAVIPSLRRLCTLMEVYAHNLAAEGHFRPALENCIGIQQLANHTGDETFLMFSNSRVVNGRALTCIRHILGSMPPDVEMLTWLKARLGPSSVSPSRIVKILSSNCSLHLQYMRDNPKAYSYWWEEYPEAIHDENKREQILKSISKLYHEHLGSALKILSSDLSYERKKTELRNLIEKYQYKDDRNDYSLILGDCMPYIESCYDLMVRDTANFNVLTVSLEIYLIKARTGHIPEKLPIVQAKDPYSDKDFQYKVIDEGFALRYRDNDGQCGKSRWVKFKVKKE